MLGPEIRREDAHPRVAHSARRLELLVRRHVDPVGNEPHAVGHRAVEGSQRARHERRVIGAEDRIRAPDERDPRENVDRVALPRVVLEHAGA